MPLPPLQGFAPPMPTNFGELNGNYAQAVQSLAASAMQPDQQNPDTSIFANYNGRRQAPRSSARTSPQGTNSPQAQALMAAKQQGANPNVNWAGNTGSFVQPGGMQQSEAAGSGGYTPPHEYYNGMDTFAHYAGASGTPPKSAEEQARTQLYQQQTRRVQQQNTSYAEATQAFQDLGFEGNKARGAAALYRMGMHPKDIVDAFSKNHLMETPAEHLQRGVGEEVDRNAQRPGFAGSGGYLDENKLDLERTKQEQGGGQGSHQKFMESKSVLDEIDKHIGELKKREHRLSPEEADSLTQLQAMRQRALDAVTHHAQELTAQQP